MADKYEKIKVRAKSGLLVTKFKDKRTGKIYNQRPVFDPTRSKVSSRLNLGMSEELKALQAAERLRLSELPPRSLPTNFTGGAIPNRQSLQSLPSTQDLIDVQRESDLVQAFNMAKPNTGEVQFPNLRPKASELAIQNQEITTPISQTGAVAGIVRGSDQDYGTNPDGSVRGQPTASKQIEMQKRSSLTIDPATNNVFTIDPATGKQVGVITRNQRRKLQERLNKKALDGGDG